MSNFAVAFQKLDDNSLNDFIVLKVIDNGNGTRSIRFVEQSTPGLPGSAAGVEDTGDTLEAGGAPSGDMITGPGGSVDVSNAGNGIVADSNSDVSITALEAAAAILLQADGSILLQSGTITLTPTTGSIELGSQWMVDEQNNGDLLVNANDVTSIGSDGARVKEIFVNVIGNTGVTLLEPTIADFSNATHNHEDAAGGEQLAEAALNLADNTTNNSTDTRHGFLPKLSGDADDALRGDGTWSPVASSAWTTVTKIADQVKTNDDTLADDSQLVFAVAANTKYRIRGWIFYSQGNATPDIKIAFTGPASPTFIAFEWGRALSTSAIVHQNIIETYLGSTAFASLAAGSGAIEFNCVLHNGANAGNFAFQWAQNTSGAQPTTVRAGSYIEYSIV